MTQRDLYVRLLGLGTPPTPAAQLTGAELLLALLHIREQVRTIGLGPKDTITIRLPPAPLTMTGEQLSQRSVEVLAELNVRLPPGAPEPSDAPPWERLVRDLVRTYDELQIASCNVHTSSRHLTSEGLLRDQDAHTNAARAWDQALRDARAATERRRDA